MVHIQDLLDDKCPNCMQPKETSEHLNRCPDTGCTQLFHDSVASLVKWMHDYNRTDAELEYWLEKYLLYQGTWSFTSLIIAGGGGSLQIMTAAASQDLIGWTEFLHGKVLVDIEAIQQLHCSLQPCRITGPDWMKAMSSHLIQILHSQWIFWNFTLRDKQRGYLWLTQRRELLREVHSLLNTLPEDIPIESRYVLELNYSTLYNGSFECQAYWTLAMKAACRAG
jgi:hypothetical protein